MDWDKATDIMVYTALLAFAIFGVLGLYQWITRKSLRKVDKPLLMLLVPCIMVLITYIIFDHIFVLNVRPDGSGEPSFPSTHTMLVATIFPCIAIILPNYIKQKSLVAFLDLVMLAFVILVPIGRVLANKHWVSDVIGGLIFSAIFAGIYLFLVKKFASRSLKNE